MSGTKDLGALVAQIGADMRQWEESMRQVEKSMQGAEKAAQTATERMNERFEKTGKKMQKIGKNMSMYLTLPIVGFGTMALKTAGNFEQSMNRVGAISQATGKDLESLEKQARDLGATTQFSASEAADAMGFLAMAGFEVKEVMSAMPSTLSLAAAGQMDLARSADIVSNVMQGFGIDASQTNKAVDVLAKTFTSANTNLEELGDAMSYAAPVAKAYGHNLEETAAAIGFLSDAGIKSTRAGTSVRQMLLQLAQKSEQLGLNLYDTEGNMKSMVGILEELESSGLSTSRIIEELGARAGPGAAVLLDRGSEALQEYVERLEDAGGTADRVAEQQMKGLNGALKEMKSAFEELMLAITGSGLLDWTTKIVKRATEWMRSLSELNPEILKWGIRIAGIAAAAGPLLLIIGKLIALIPTLTAGIVALKTAALGPLGLAIAGIYGVWKLWNNQILQTQKFADGLADKSLSELKSQAEKTREEIEKLEKAHAELSKRASERGTTSMGPGMATQGLDAAQTKEIALALEKRREQLKVLEQHIDSAKNVQTSEEGITNEIEKQTASLEELLEGAEGVENVVEEIGQGFKNATKAVNGFTSVVEKSDEAIITALDGTSIFRQQFIDIEEGAKNVRKEIKRIGEDSENAGNNLNITLESIGMAISDTANAFTSFGNAIQRASEDGAVSFVESMNIITQAAMSAIGVLQAVASAKFIASEAGKGLIGLLTMTAGLATLAALFASYAKPKKTQGLMYGGDVIKSGMFEVGESGRENVFLPQGAAVRPQSTGMEEGTLKFEIEDDKLIALLDWAERKKISFG